MFLLHLLPPVPLLRNVLRMNSLRNIFTHTLPDKNVEICVRENIKTRRCRLSRLQLSGSAFPPLRTPSTTRTARTKSAARGTPLGCQRGLENSERKMGGTLYEMRNEIMYCLQELKFQH